MRQRIYAGSAKQLVALVNLSRSGTIPSMRWATRFVGSSLMVAGLAGLLLVMGLPYLNPVLPRPMGEVLASLLGEGSGPPQGRVAPAALPTLEATPTALPTAEATATPVPPVATQHVAASGTSTPVPPTRTPVPTPTITPTPTPLPITRVRVLSSVPIDSEVVVSPLVEVAGGVTWEVPAFKVGHAEFTAGAGQEGNGVLLGHVNSRGLGNVFQQLDKARVGDKLEVFSGARRFDYRVVETRVVPRTEVSVLDPTPNASVSLITCVGLWNPLLNDYMERLVVRAELVETEPTPVPS